MTQRPQIRIERSPNAEYRLIMVDGVQWGTIGVTRYGRVTRYYFHQTGKGHGHGNNIRRDGAAVFIVNNRQEERPLDERLAEEVGKLIAEGLLRHPDIVLRAIALDSDRKAFRATRAEEASQRAFEARALAAIAPYVPKNKQPAAVAAVLAAMRWAQVR